MMRRESGEHGNHIFTSLILWLLSSFSAIYSMYFITESKSMDGLTFLVIPEQSLVMVWFDPLFIIQRESKRGEGQVGVFVLVLSTYFMLTHYQL